MEGFHFFFFSGCSAGLGEATEDGGEVAGSSRVVSFGVFGRGGGDIGGSRSGSPVEMKLCYVFG